MSGDLRGEEIELARELIRIDTSNPPGGETPAAELLAGYLGEAGLECELAGPDPERLNLIARLRGRGEGPSLMLLAHTDVVPAPPEGWSVPPFEGIVRDGLLIGRGATDMKNELAARAVALAAIARGGERPAGDLVLVAESDEERNTAGVGMSWLVRERPDLRCDYALNEGGGVLLELAGGGRVLTVSVGEKRVTSLRLRLLGRGGHASVPAQADNPLVLMARAIAGLAAYTPPAEPSPELAAALAAVGAPGDGEEAAFAWAAGQHPELADLLPVLTRMTVTPTGAEASEPANVIPPQADLVCDCRTLPGQGEAEIRAHIAAALDGIPYELELLEPLEGGTASPTRTPLYAAIESWLAERLPGAALLPVVSPGFTDSHWVREAWGTVAYGFAPVINTGVDAYVRAAHADDESLAVADLTEMAEFHLHALRAFAAGAGSR